MRKTHDYTHHYRGLWRDGGRCRIEVYAPDRDEAGRPPVIVATELPDNDNTSITNLAEVLAADVVAAIFPERLEEVEPVIWLEHYPGRRDPRRNVRSRSEVDRVTFASWTPRPSWLGGVLRRTLGEPTWHPLTPDDVAALIGAGELEE